MILNNPISIQYLAEIAKNFYGDMIKAAADVDAGIIAIDAELHSDLEKELLENGSSQEAIWGFNIYPDMIGDNFIEFDSLIKIRPRQGNRSRNVENASTREKIRHIVTNYIK